MQYKTPMERTQQEKIINKPKDMTLVGLTGGLASGKTEVARIWQEHGLPVIFMDELAKSLYLPGAPVYLQLIAKFGTGILDEHKHVDRGKLAALVFNAPEKLATLNSIVHPAVFRAAEQRIWSLFQQGFMLVVLESAILFDSGLARAMDLTIAVTAPMEIRLERAVKRGMDRQDAVSRLKSQAASWEGQADHVLLNDKDLDTLHNEAVRLAKWLKQRYGIKRTGTDNG